MKVKARKLLSLLLTLAMVVGMFVLPASAAKGTKDDKIVYTLEVGPDKDVTSAKTSGEFAEGYFTVLNGVYDNTSNKYGHGTEILGDGETTGGGYTPTASLKLGAVKQSEAAKADKKTIHFTTKYDNATVTVWWTDANDNRKVAISTLDEAGKNAVTDQLNFTATTKASHKSQVTIPTAETTVYISAWKPESGSGGGDIYVHKVEVVDGEVNAATAVAIDDKTTTTLAVDGELQLSATVTATKTDKPCSDDVKWTTGDEEIATVDETGKVTAVADGTVTITVTAGSVSDSITLTVGTGTKHTHGTTWNEDASTRVAPTCTKPGSVIEKCENADCPGREKVIPATGHDWDENNVCKNGCGEERVLVYVHFFDGTDGGTNADKVKAAGYAASYSNSSGSKDSIVTLLGTGVGGTVNSTYKHLSPSRANKMTSNGRGFTFTAPEDGKLYVYFDSASASKTLSKKVGDTTSDLTVPATAIHEEATTAGTSYTYQYKSNSVNVPYLIWVNGAEAAHTQHVYDENYVNAAGDTWYCTYPTCTNTTNEDPFAAEQPKDMTVTAADVNVPYDGQAHGIEVKVTVPATGATVKYGTAADACNQTASPTITNVSDSPKTVYYEVTATGYNTVKGSKTITITKATPTVTAVVEGDSSIQSATASDRVATVAVTVSDYATSGNITVKAVDANDAEIDGVTLTKGSNGKWKTNELPDVTKAYFFKATLAGTDNYNAASGKTRQFSITNSAEKLNCYKLNYDTEKITIRGNKPDPNDATKFEDKSAVFATAKVPAGKEFDHWEAEGKTLDETQKKTATDMKFIMPPNDMTLTAIFKDKTAETVAVTGVELNTDALELIAGEDATLIASVQPGKATNKAVTWASDKPAVATVDANGKVVAVAAGTAIITVTTADGGKTDTCTVTVTAASSGPETTTDEASLVVGDFEIKDKTISNQKEPLTSAEVKGAENAKGYFDVVGTVNKRWDSGDASAAVTAFDILKRTESGFTITLKAGQTATMTAMLNGASTTAGRKAWPKLTKDDVEVAYEGETIDALPLAKEESKAVVWKNLSTGTYFLTGVTTESNTIDMRVKNITLNITTTTGGSVPVTGVSLNKATASVAVGTPETLVATIAPANATNKKLTWTSSDEAVATVDATGKVTAVAAGTATITVTTANGKTASCVVTVPDSSTPVDPGTSTGGGGSSVPSSGGGTTVTNPDGSKTNTKTNKTTGTVTETTTYPNGDKTVVVTEKDGTKTETVTKKDGTKSETVTKPDGSVKSTVTDAKGIKTETATSASGDTTAKVTLPNRVKKAVVTIPVKNVTEGTVAVIVAADGTEKVIKTSMAGEAGLELLVDKNVSVKIKDNAKKFQDIADDYWAKGAVDFASSREIFKGTTDVTFSPMDLVDRGMMATVLFRLADAKVEGENSFFDVPDGNWYTDAVTWANRSGVVTGYADGTFGPADAVTREQMATMLYRYAKVMGMDISAKGDMSKFGDANDVSSWASEALTWAVGVGLINGVGDPVNGVTLAPAKTASRAEVATIMQRMVKLMMQ